jgi:hypothetical protein
MNTKWMLTILLMVLAVGTGLIAAKESHKLEPMLRTVDLNVGEKTSVELCNGKTVTVMLLAVKETRDELRNAVRHTEVRISVNDKEITLTAAYYRLPVTVGDVQIDCAVTRGFVQSNNDRWGLHADARLRLWLAGSPWIRPGTFCYPVKQRWFASDTQMANVPVFVDGGEVPSNKSIYYHSGLDVGGMENMVAMTPQNGLASTQYCLANPGKEYLVYLPSGVKVSVDLTAAKGVLAFEWFNPSMGKTTKTGTVPGGARRNFTVPFAGDAVLYLALAKSK